MSEWRCLSPIVTIESEWASFFAEKWQDDDGRLLEYWRVKKNDSVIILPLFGDRFCVPKPSFRVGVNRETVDFPGGRVPEGAPAELAVPGILRKELGVPEDAIIGIKRINQRPWLIDSSFSNQHLYAVLAEIERDCVVPDSFLGRFVNADAAGVSCLLSELECMQCRLTLQEWRHQNL
jgi:hypothetical protein